ncbi:spore gernimation protein GerA (plasmid) [Bacillaceae bacterium JMAK1]|nr:spore gernimation protein GerA [Bacillaceae bacterium JMAK1]
MLTTGDLMFKKHVYKKLNLKKGKTLEDLIQACQKSFDFVSYQATEKAPFHLHYIKSLVDEKQIDSHISSYTKNPELPTLIDLEQSIPIEGTKIIQKIEEIEQSLLSGHVIIQVTKHDNEVLAVPVQQKEQRSVDIPENEFTVIGPKEAFIESLDVNLNLIRKRLPVPELVIKEFIVGSISKSRVAVLHMDGITNTQLVQTLTERINEVDYDEIVDSSQITQLISDNPNSYFPQLLETERPERVASALVEGKVVFTMEGSPQAMIGPTNLLEFFSSPDDHYMMWPLSMFFRIIRLLAVLFSVLATSVYIAVTTYHHEVIPDVLLNTMVASRLEVPYPPIIEVILLELTVELLREAGARLPSRIGQTIGIVGGIVIGTAVVEASLASSVLLILIGLTALSSFTTPIYQMGNTIRILRFPFIIFAQWFGFFGMAICLAIHLLHLIKLTSLGYPYLSPLYPFRVRDFRDEILKLPIQKLENRPEVLRSQKKKRFISKYRKHPPKDIEE